MLILQNVWKINRVFAKKPVIRKLLVPMVKLLIQLAHMMQITKNANAILVPDMTIPTLKLMLKDTFPTVAV